MVLYKTAQHVGNAKIAVEVREEEGTEDIGRCCRGGESGHRYRFARELREKMLCKWHRRTSRKYCKDYSVLIRVWGVTPACFPPREVGETARLGCVVVSPPGEDAVDRAATTGCDSCGCRWQRRHRHRQGASVEGCSVVREDEMVFVVCLLRWVFTIMVALQLTHKINININRSNDQV